MSCGVDVAPLRAEPRDDAEQVTQALLHEPLRVDARREGWARVVTVYGYPGWVPTTALAAKPGALPRASAAEPLEAARGYLGSRYEWGGMTRAGIDCSGLVHMSFRAVGILVPRDAWQQEIAGAPVPRGAEVPGDVVAYGAGVRADHVSFWCGDGKILHATARRGEVTEEPEPSSLRAHRRGVVRLRDGGAHK